MLKAEMWEEKQMKVPSKGIKAMGGEDALPFTREHKAKGESPKQHGSWADRYSVSALTGLVQQCCPSYP